MQFFKKHPLWGGTLLLTSAGFLTRIIGFFYRIFLSRIIGAEGLGIYQMVFPLYALCLSLGAAGIQTGISRCCAAALEEKDRGKARQYFLGGTILSLFITGLTACFLYRYSEPICLSVLKEERCIPLLRLISFSLIPAAIHTCISSWYFASKKAVIPAVSQILEQLCRVGCSYLLYTILTANHTLADEKLAIYGTLAGEAAACLFTLICYLLESQSSFGQPHRKTSMISCTKTIFRLSVPLTANRALVTLLQSTEAILIPAHLRLSGLGESEALSTYGVLTGMALPFILFPSAITNSVSTLLLPKVAGEQAVGDHKAIQNTTEQTIRYCLYLGIFFAGTFFFFGGRLGEYVFDSREAGIYLQILSFLCPFLYLSSTLTGILNGLGHTFLCFLQNVAGLTVRILFVVYAIPRLGIRGYLAGLLVSQLIISALNLLFLRREIPITSDGVHNLLLPALAMLLSNGIGLYSLHILEHIVQLPLISCALSLGLSGLCYVFFLIGMGLFPGKT